MSRRICPNCHNELGNYDHYFCSVCGAELPKEFTSDHVDVKVKEYNPLSSVKPDKFPIEVNTSSLKGLFHPKAFMGILLVVLVLVIDMVIDRYYPVINLLAPHKEVNIEVSETTSTPTTAMQFIDLPLTGNSMYFANQDINEYVPAEAELYVYSNNLGQFLSNISEVDVYNKLFSELPTTLDKPFAFYTVDIEGSKDWAIIVPIKETTAVASILNATLRDFANYSFTQDYLIVASNKQVIELSLAAKSKTILSISLSPKYVQAQTKLPKEGLVVIMFLDLSGRASFENAKNYKIGNTLKNTIDAVLKTRYNELVII